MRLLDEFPDVGRIFELSKLKDKLMEIPPIRLYASIMRLLLDVRPVPIVARYIMRLYQEDPDETVFVFGEDVIKMIQKMF